MKQLGIVLVVASVVAGVDYLAGAFLGKPSVAAALATVGLLVVAHVVPVHGRTPGQNLCANSALVLYGVALCTSILWATS